MSALNALVDPFRLAFMQRALVETLLLSVPAGLLGSWIVLRRLAFFTHALGHATFPALVVAALAGWSLFGAAFVAALAIALALARLAERPELAEGVAVAVVLAAALAVGAVLLSDVADPFVGARTLLFGSLLTLGGGDLARSAAAAGLAVALTVLFGRSLTAIAFDRRQARAMGLPVAALDALLLVALAAAIAVAVGVVGSLMVSGLFLVPSATARLLTRRVLGLQVLGVALAALDSVVGLWMSFRLDAPPGACIAAVAAAVFVLTALVRAVGQVPSRGRMMKTSVS